MLDGRNLNLIKSNSLSMSSSKHGGWAGALSSNRRHFNGNPFSIRYFFTLGAKTSCMLMSSIPGLCICPPHFRQFSFHYIIPLKHSRIILVINQKRLHLEITTSVTTHQKSQPVFHGFMTWHRFFFLCYKSAIGYFSEINLFRLH